MSAIVKLSSKLPGDPEINGLDAWADWLCKANTEPLIAVVYIDSAKTTKDLDNGTEVPTARIRRIEPLGVVGDVSDAIRAAVATAEQERTGRTPLPFETLTVGEYRNAEPLDAE